MTDYTSYELHAEAYGDIDEIRGYIATVMHGHRSPRVMPAILRGREA